MDPILLRGLERIFIAIGAVIFAYLGYRLFLKGKDSGPGSMKVESDLLKVVVSGQGPGLFFMAFGATVLMFSILSGGAKVSESGSELKSTSPHYDHALSRINEIIASLDSASRQELMALVDKIDEMKYQNERLYEYVRDSELQMAGPSPRYTNEKLGGMMEELDQKIEELNAKVDELTKR